MYQIKVPLKPPAYISREWGTEWLKKRHHRPSKGEELHPIEGTTFTSHNTRRACQSQQYVKLNTLRKTARFSYRFLTKWNSIDIKIGRKLWHSESLPESGVHIRSSRYKIRPPPKKKNVWTSHSNSSKWIYLQQVLQQE